MNKMKLQKKQKEIAVLYIHYKKWVINCKKKKLN